MFVQPEYYQTVLGAIALVIVLSLALERALSVPFEWGVWDKGLEAKRLRAPIALLVAWLVCVHMQFDLLQYLTKAEKSWVGPFSIGTILTAAVIAGGSKGAILLFQGILGFGKEAVDTRVARKTSVAVGAPRSAAGTAVQWWKRRP